MILHMLFLLVGPYLVLTLAERLPGAPALERSVKGRLGLSLFLLWWAASHFTRTVAMLAMLPAWTPMRLEIVYATGILEFGLAVAIWLPGLVRPAGALLIAMLVVFLPVTVYAAVQGIDFGGYAYGPRYLLVRIPFQFFVIWWCYRSTGQAWLGAKTGGPERAP